MFNDGDIYRTPDNLIICILDKDKNKILIKDYLSNETFCTEKQLLARKKKSFWGNIHQENSIRSGFIHDSIINLLREVFLETAIIQVLKIPRWTFILNDEDWSYFRIKIIKKIYYFAEESEYWRLDYDILNKSLIRFLEDNLEMQSMSNYRKICVLEAILKDEIQG